MKLVVGLGNPGLQYAATRHNIGFMVIDRLAARLGAGAAKHMHHSLVQQAAVAGEKILLAKPQTYMNASGEAVAALLRWYRLPLFDLLVISDDMDLPVGRLRLRKTGGHGGHNGLRSIIELVGGRDFTRLRVGIGRPADCRHDPVDWVLGRFTPEEMELIAPALDAAAEAVETAVAEGIDAAMNRYNAREKV